MELLRRRPAIVLDAAHNVASAQALVDTLDQSFTTARKLLIFATSRDKDVRGMLEVLAPRFDCLLLSRYGSNTRSAAVEELERLARELTSRPVRGHADLESAWLAAREWLRPDDLAVISGSFFMAGEMLAAMRASARLASPGRHVRRTPTGPNWR